MSMFNQLQPLSLSGKKYPPLLKLMVIISVKPRTNDSFRTTDTK